MGRPDPGKRRVDGVIFVIASGAKQSRATRSVRAALDCFVASLLAMTESKNKRVDAAVGTDVEAILGRDQRLEAA
jgi:hypothetical protein